MSNVTIQLPDEKMRRVEVLAKKAEMPVADYLRARIEKWLGDEDFATVARNVIEKNHELYQRLGQKKMRRGIEI